MIISPDILKLKAARLILAVAAAFWAGMAPAQSTQSVVPDNQSSVARNFELPAHRRLQRLRQAPQTKLAPFTTDGCSGGLSEIWGMVADQFPSFADAYEALPPWEGCCVTHDRAYHTAGPDPDAEASFEARLQADLALQTCVVDTADARMEDMIVQYDATPEQIKSAYATIGAAMFGAVRLGGVPCSTLPWRWGYGYPDCSWLSKIPD